MKYRIVILTAMGNGTSDINCLAYRLADNGVHFQKQEEGVWGFVPMSRLIFIDINTVATNPN